MGMDVITTSMMPMAKIPSVEPILELSSTGGVEVICIEKEAALKFRAEATG